MEEKKSEEYECYVKKDGLYKLILKFKGRNNDAEELDFVSFALQTIVCKNDVGNEVRIDLTPQFQFVWVEKTENLRSASNYVKDVLGDIVICATKFDTQLKVDKLNNIMSCLLISSLMKPADVNEDEYEHFREYLKSVEPILKSTTSKFIGHHTVTVEHLCLDECSQKRRANTQGVNNPMLCLSLRVLGPLEFQNCIVSLEKSSESAEDLDLTNTDQLLDLVNKKSVKLILVDGNNRIGQLNPKQKVSISLYSSLTSQEKIAISKANSGSLQISENLNPWSDIAWKLMKYLDEMLEYSIIESKSLVESELNDSFAAEYTKKEKELLVMITMRAFEDPGFLLAALHYNLVCEGMSIRAICPTKLKCIFRSNAFTVSNMVNLTKAFKKASELLVRGVPDGGIKSLYKIYRLYESSQNSLFAEYVKAFFARQDRLLPPQIFQTDSTPYLDMQPSVLLRKLCQHQLYSKTGTGTRSDFVKRFEKAVEGLQPGIVSEYFVNLHCYNLTPANGDALGALHTFLTIFYGELLLRFDSSLDVCANADEEVLVSSDDDAFHQVTERKKRKRKKRRSGSGQSQKKPKVDENSSQEIVDGTFSAPTLLPSSLLHGDLIPAVPSSEKSSPNAGASSSAKVSLGMNSALQSTVPSTATQAVPSDEEMSSVSLLAKVVTIPLQSAVFLAATQAGPSSGQSSPTNGASSSAYDSLGTNTTLQSTVPSTATQAVPSDVEMSSIPLLAGVGTIPLQSAVPLAATQAVSSDETNLKGSLGENGALQSASPQTGLSAIHSIESPVPSTANQTVSIQSDVPSAATQAVPSGVSLGENSALQSASPQTGLPLQSAVLPSVMSPAATQTVSPVVDPYVSSWPTETNPDYEQFISFVRENECVWKDDAATVTPSEAIVLNALFPEKVIELQQKKWLGMDMIHTFMSTLCYDQSTVYFDWGESTDGKRQRLLENLPKIGLFKVFVIFNKYGTHWVLLVFEVNIDRNIFKGSIYDSFATFTFADPDVQIITQAIKSAVSFEGKESYVAIYKERVQSEDDGWSCGIWMVKSAFKNSGFTEVSVEDSIETFQNLLMRNFSIWVRAWMGSINSPWIFFCEVEDNSEGLHSVKKVGKVVFHPDSVLVSGTFYRHIKDGKVFKLELGVLHGHLYIFLESQDQNCDHRVILGSALERMGFRGSYCEIQNTY